MLIRLFSFFLLNHGQYVRVTALNGSWARVETAAGDVGYVYKDYLRRVYIDGLEPEKETGSSVIPAGAIEAVAVKDTCMYVKNGDAIVVVAEISAGDLGAFDIRR